MKVNADRISEVFESNRQELLRLEETSFLSTGGQLRTEPQSMDDIFTVNTSVQQSIEVKDAESAGTTGEQEEISFHPFKHKYLMLEDIFVSHVPGTISLYKEKVAEEVRRGLGFEESRAAKVEQLHGKFHPFGRKYEVNTDKIMRKVF